MNGNNTLMLNQAEMVKAVALYLETKVFNADYMKNIVVADVDKKSDGYSKEWTIKLEEKSEQQK